MPLSALTRAITNRPIVRLVLAYSGIIFTIATFLTFEIRPLLALWVVVITLVLMSLQIVFARLIETNVFAPAAWFGLILLPIAFTCLLVALVVASFYGLSSQYVSEVTSSPNPNIWLETNPNIWLETKLKEKLKGQIAIQIPETMDQGEEQKVTVRIAANTSEDLTKGLAEKGNPTVDNIDVVPYMTVKLVADDAFEVVPLTPEDQFIGQDTFTQWQFNLKATGLGQHEVDLLVGVRIKSKNGNETRFLPTYEHKIVIKVRVRYAIVRFVQKNWKWICGTLILPIIWFFVKRRLEKNKGEEKSEKEDNDDSGEEEDDDS